MVPSLADGGWTSPPEDGSPPRPAADDDGAVTVPVGTTLVPAAAVVPLPVLAGVDADGLLGEGGTSLETSSETLPVRVVEEAESLPYVGPAGLLVDLPSFLLLSDPPPPLVLSSVLVRDDAPAEVVDGLLGAGLVRVGGVDDERRALDDSAYAQALRLYLVVGAVLLLMALGGLLVSIAVQMPARRRDAASLRVVGVPRRTVVLSSVWESVVVLGAAALAGVLAGVAALAVLLPSLDLGVTDDAVPPAGAAGARPHAGGAGGRGGRRGAAGRRRDQLGAHGPSGPGREPSRDGPLRPTSLVKSRVIR